MTAATTQHQLCPDCGAPVPIAAPEGLCPRCLAMTAVESAGQATTDALGERLVAQRFFGDYELLEEVARGGMGIVFKARQLGVNRVVALKVLAGGAAAGREFVHRFHNEAAAAARLDHPHSVPIYEFGEHEGTHFLAMQFMEGSTLQNRIAQGLPTPVEAARIIIAVASAIAHAHRRGVLHRDLKPGNVLLDADGSPRVADFGLARLPEEDSSLTLSHAVLGTAAYMAPEVAIAGAARATTASDIYGLGAILYELLAGRPPFISESLPALLKEIGEEEPVAPRVLNPGLPRDLETICLKCLEKEPAKRYATAQELADELGRFVRDEPIDARPTTRAERAWRWCRRKPALAASIVLVLVLLVVLGIGGPITAFRVNQARLLAEQNRLLAEQNLYASDMRLASQAVHEGAFNHARELLEQHLPKRGEADLRGFEWRYLAQTVQESEPFLTLEGLPAPSGWEETFLFRSERFLYNQSGDQLKAWNMDTWKPVPLAPPALPASAKWQWDPSRELAYAVDQTQNTVTVYALPKFQAGSTVGLPGSVSAVAMSQDRQALAVGFQEGVSHRVLIWDLAREARIGTLGNFQTEVSRLVFSRDRTLLAAGSMNGVIAVWDLKRLEPLAAPNGDSSHVRPLEFTPDNKRLLFGKYPSLSVWDISESRFFSVGRIGRHRLGWYYGLSPDAAAILILALAVLEICSEGHWQTAHDARRGFF